jgi:hypothetical protein
MSNNNEVIHHKFSSLAKLVEAAKQDAEHVPDMYRSSREERHDNWSGGTFLTALEQATFGWPEGLKEIRRRAKDYAHIFDDQLPKQDLQKHTIMDVTGESVDIGMMLQGIPENMITYIEQETDSKLITGNKLQRIVYSSAFSCGIDKETVFNYGAMILTLVNAMEGHGFRTEIVCRTSEKPVISSVKSNYIVDNVIKTFDESPDMDKLAFCFASSMYFRRLYFSIIEQEPSIATLQAYGVGQHGGGYGIPSNYKNDLVLATDIFIPKLEANIPFDTIANNFKQLVNLHFKQGQNEQSTTDT